MKISFKINSGVTWNDGAEPLAMVRHNVELDGLTGSNCAWDSFGDDAVKLNKDGETTISLVNNGTTAADFSAGSLQIVIQIDSQYTADHDLCEIELDEEDEPVITGEVKIVIE